MSVGEFNINPEKVVDIRYSYETDLITIEWAEPYKDGVVGKFSKDFGPRAVGLSELIKTVIEDIQNKAKDTMACYQYVLEKINTK